jgi:hypothetical protein
MHQPSDGHYRVAEHQDAVTLISASHLVRIDARLSKAASEQAMKHGSELHAVCVGSLRMAESLDIDSEDAALHWYATHHASVAQP